jgi:hypothetical protein
MRHHAGRTDSVPKRKKDVMTLLKTLIAAALLSTFAVASFAKPVRHHHRHHHHHHHHHVRHG